MDSCCFIDAVKQDVGNLPSDRNADVWHIKKLLEAHRKGDVVVYTSMLTLAECVAVEAGQAEVPQDVQDRFRILLTNGQYLILAQPTPRTADMARDLRWKEKLVLGGPDAIHVATALEVNAVEMLSTDDRLNGAKMAAAVSHLSNRLRIIRASDTRCLPGDYLQGELMDNDG
jgi:predicted nucleic acid-binding protein